MLFQAAARVSVSALCVLIMSIRGHVTRDMWRGLIGHSVISTNNQHGHQTTSHIPTWCYQFKTSLDLNLIIYLPIWQKLCFLCLPEGNPCSLHQYCQCLSIHNDKQPRSWECILTRICTNVNIWMSWAVFAACKVIPMAPIRHPAATCKCWSPDTRASNEGSRRFHNHREGPY